MIFFMLPPGVMLLPTLWDAQFFPHPRVPTLFFFFSLSKMQSSGLPLVAYFFSKFTFDSLRKYILWKKVKKCIFLIWHIFFLDYICAMPSPFLCVKVKVPCVSEVVRRRGGCLDFILSIQHTSDTNCVSQTLYVIYITTPYLDQLKYIINILHKGSNLYSYLFHH